MDRRKQHLGSGRGSGPRRLLRAERPAGDAATSAEAGWADLSAGRWEAAGDAFRESLASEETPEALEGLSWSAWWLDDVEAVLDARRRAYALYRERGANASAARMATWVGADHFDFHGALAVTKGWLRRARRLLAEVEPGPDHGWLAFHVGYIASMEGDTERGRQEAVRAAEIGRRFRVPDLEMLGLALEGSVLVGRAEVEEGMGCLDEAVVTALQAEATIPISRAWTCCFLVGACEAVRDYRRAFEWCDRIAEFAERYGSLYMLGFCRSHYGAVHMWAGRWEVAEFQLEEAVRAYTGSRPPFVSDPLAKLAELHRRKGEWERAEELLDQMGAGSVPLCRARLALDRGEPRRALELVDRVLRQLPRQSRMKRFAALEIVVRARVENGTHDLAAEALIELKEIAGRVGTEPLRAAVDMAEGVLAAAVGEPERATRLLEGAGDAFERSGAPFEAAQARLALASTLFGLHRTDLARRQATTCLKCFEALGAAADVREARRLIDLINGGDTSATTLPRITRREREVLRWVAEGLTNRQVGARLSVSEHTIHRHVTNILRKLDLPSRAAAAAHAVRAGLLGPPAQ